MTIGLTRQRRLSESIRSAVSVLQVEEHNANQQKDKNTLRQAFLRKTIFGVLLQNLFIFLTVVTGEKCPKTNHLLREGVICAMCNENVQCALCNVHKMRCSACIMHGPDYKLMATL